MTDEFTHPTRNGNPPGVQRLPNEGNLIELAVAFVPGVAFAALLNAFVADIIMPIVGAIFGKVDFSNLTSIRFGWSARLLSVDARAGSRNC